MIRYRFLGDGTEYHYQLPARDITDEDYAIMSEGQKKLLRSSPLFETVPRNAAQDDSEQQARLSARNSRQAAQQAQAEQEEAQRTTGMASSKETMPAENKGEK